MREIRVNLEHLRALFENLSSDEVLQRAPEIFSGLSAHAEFRLEGDEVIIQLPDATDSVSAEASRMAERAAKKASAGDLDKAISLWQRALELDSTDYSARRDLAMALYEKGRADEARDELIEVLKLKPDDAWGFVILGNIFARFDDNLEQASKHYLRALELSPEDPWALNSMGALLLEKKDIEAALTYFEKAIKLHPALPNPYMGKANALGQRGDIEASQAALLQLFRNARHQDARSKVIFREARRLFRGAASALAQAKQSDSFKAVAQEKAELEAKYQVPIREDESELDAKIVAAARMAWKHSRSYHQVVIRPGVPEPIKHHATLHELTHIRMESEARSKGVNRWFALTQASRERAIRDNLAGIQKISKKLGESRATSLANSLIQGACGFVFNAPLDWLIEQRVRRDFPDAKWAQFCGLTMMADEALEVTMNPEIRRVTMPKVLRLNDILNGASALFIDEFTEGATDYVEHYRGLKTFDKSREVFSFWEAKTSTSLSPGEEYQLVDGIAEIIGASNWYEWKSDPGDPVRADSESLAKEQGGSTNPELLKEKSPATIMYLIGALERFNSLDDEAVRMILTDIGLQGMKGLDYSSPDRKYTVAQIPGESFSGLQMMCMMFAASKRIMPLEDTGIDFDSEWEQALSLYNQKSRGEQ